MKLIKTDFLDFLKKVHLEGMVEELVIEDDGSVDVSIENKINIFGKVDSFKGFGKRVGIGNPEQLIKMIGALETADNTITADIKGNDLVLATRSGKFTYKLADADTIDSIRDMEEKFRALKKEMKGKIQLSIETVNSIKKSISVLCKGDKDVISLFASDGALQAIAVDDATKNTAATQISNIEGEFKLDFKAGDFDKIINQIGANGATLFIEDEKPICLELADKSFLYMMAFVLKDKEQA